MLAQINRLDKKTFKEVFHSGRSFNAEHFFIKILKQDRVSGPRFSVVVSKKIASKAVSRNKIKRQIYNSLRFHLADINKDVLAILIIKKNTANLPFFDIKSEIKNLLERSGALG